MFVQPVDNNLLNQNQHGFLPYHSTVSQLLECYYDWSCANDVGYPVDVLSIDFNKVFATLSHYKLVSKIKSFNFFDKTIDWIFSFLHNRTQAIKFTRNFPCSFHVTNGVPRGSVNGPFIHILLTNYLPFVCYPNFIKMYADDLLCYVT